MSVPDVKIGGNVDVAAIKVEINNTNTKLAEINKDKNSQSIFTDVAKATDTTGKDEAALAAQEAWLNYIINMYERIAEAAMRVQMNLETSGSSQQRSLIYDGMSAGAAVTPEETAKVKHNHETKETKDKEDKKDKEVKDKKDKEDKEVKDKEIKDKKEKEGKEVKDKK